MIWVSGLRDHDITDDHIDSLARFAKTAGVAVDQPASPHATGAWAVSERQALRILSRSADAAGRRLTCLSSRESARAAARLAALSALATMRADLGSFDLVRRIVSLRGVVNATADFTAHTQVIDAASELFVQVFGQSGQHARLAVGVNSLPANLALEIEMLVELTDSTRRSAAACRSEIPERDDQDHPD